MIQTFHLTDLDGGAIGELWCRLQDLEMGQGAKFYLNSMEMLQLLASWVTSTQLLLKYLGVEELKFSDMLAKKLQSSKLVRQQEDIATSVNALEVKPVYMQMHQHTLEYTSTR